MIIRPIQTILAITLLFGATHLMAGDVPKTGESTVTLFVGPSPVLAQVTFVDGKAPDADALLSRIELDVALKQYEKIMTETLELERSLIEGPPPAFSTNDQTKKMWAEIQRKSMDSLLTLREKLRAEIQRLTDEANKESVRNQAETKPKPEEYKMFSLIGSGDSPETELNKLSADGWKFKATMGDKVILLAR